MEPPGRSTLACVDEDIEQVAVRAGIDAVETLAQTTWLGPAIDADVRAGRFERWGSSTVIDEHVGGPVISAPLFAALHSRAGLAAQWPVGNAGLLHVYGYLLSTVPTPFGFKRDRWLTSTLATAYGLSADAFVPGTSPRTLLERVTEAADGLSDRATVRQQEVTGVATSVALDRRSFGGAWALVYIVEGRLVTTFTVESAEQILDEWDAAEPALRWNAVDPRRRS